MPLPEVDPYPRRRSVWPTLLLFLVAVLIGMGAMAWLFSRYDVVADRIDPRPPTIVTPKPLTPPPVIRIAAPPPSAVVGAIVDERIDTLEAKVDRIDERAQAASGEASRAEGLLVAFAARRAIDRGVSLGYLEGILRDRFGGVEPQAVAMVISASRAPVTIEQLRDQLDALSPRLSGAATDEGWWDGFRRQLGSLIVIRKADVQSVAPVDRLARAHDDLAAGQVDAALAEVARLPARAAAQGWIASARRYVQARVALDRVETAALLRPAVAAPVDGTIAAPAP